MKDNFFIPGRRLWKGIFRAAVNPSLEAAGKTLRCAVPAARKPWVAIHGHPRDACVAPVFFTPRKIPFQSQRLVICIVLHEYFALDPHPELLYCSAGLKAFKSATTSVPVPSLVKTSASRLSADL